MKKKVEREEASAKLKPLYHLGDFHLDKEFNFIENDKDLQDFILHIEEMEGEPVCPRACHNANAKRSQ